MTILSEWAKTWGIPEIALKDLGERLTFTAQNYQTIERETDAMKNVRLIARKKNCILWRNNVGAFKTDTGVWIRTGLANDSKNMNRNVKSADLIGIRAIRIKPEHVGRVIGQFCAREVKRLGWEFSGNSHETAQQNFLTLVNLFGGDGQFTTGHFE